MTGATPRAAADYSTSIAYEEALQIFRLHRPGCWQPSIEVIGIGNLEAAVGSGNGALIWNAFAFSIITKMGLKQEGFPLNYLSRPEHGFYPMDVGKFRGIVQRAENRYLASRVIIRRKLAVDAMRVSVALLAANRVVGIAYGDQASQLISVPLLAGMLQVPTGPLNLSRLTKAPILPTFTIQETSERFRVEINPPIPMPEGVSRHDQLSSAAREYASVLERYIRRYPHLWNGWQLYWSEDRSAQLDG